MTVERYYEDAKVGDECITPSVTVTAAMINAYADLSGDHTPIHVDEEYARKSDFGTRVAHGLLGLSLADGLKTQAEYRFLPGKSLGWTWDFVAPIKINDTVHVRFRVGSMRTIGGSTSSTQASSRYVPRCGWFVNGSARESTETQKRCRRGN